MSQRLTRKEMKRDEVGEALSRTMVFLTGHLKQAAWVIAGIVAILLIGTLLDRMIGGRRDDASDALARAIETLNSPLASEAPAGAQAEGAIYATSAERGQAALDQFEAILEKYPRNPSGRIATSYVASLAHEQGDVERARSLWQDLSGGEDAVSAQATLNLLTLDREQGRSAEAEGRLLTMLEEDDASLPEDVILFQLALTQEALGKTTESRETLTRLVDEHPRSVHVAEANRKLGS